MYNKSMRELGSKRSAIRELYEYGRKRKQIIGEENVFDFSLGNPSIKSPASIDTTIKELVSNDTSILHGYTTAAGNVTLRKKIADEFNLKYGTDYSENNLYITCGAAASLTIAFKALSTGQDEILAISPYFPEYKVFVESAGSRFNTVKSRLDDFQIDFIDLNKKINEKTKGIIINSPNNPSGVVYFEETIIELAKFLRRKEKEYRHPIYIISDEPYREIVYDNIKLPFIPDYYDDTIICYSYSKALSIPGERIGYILVPNKLYDSKKIYECVMGAGRALGYVCAPSLFQKVLEKCYKETSDMKQYEINRNLLYNSLKSIGYECVYPSGAFYLFVKCLEDDSIRFCECAKNMDLLIVPSDSFGVRGYARIAYCVSKDVIEKSLPSFQKLYDIYRK